MKLKCPCENCICIPLCRHKHIHQLFRECSILHRYDPEYDNVEKRKKERLFHLQRIMKPSRWEFGFIPDNPFQKYPVLYHRSSKHQYLVER